MTFFPQSSEGAHNVLYPFAMPRILFLRGEIYAWKKRPLQNSKAIVGRRCCIVIAPLLQQQHILQIGFVRKRGVIGTGVSLSGHLCVGRRRVVLMMVSDFLTLRFGGGLMVTASLSRVLVAVATTTSGLEKAAHSGGGGGDS